MYWVAEKEPEEALLKLTMFLDDWESIKESVCWGESWLQKAEDEREAKSRGLSHASETLKGNQRYALLRWFPSVEISGWMQKKKHWRQLRILALSCWACKALWLAESSVMAERDPYLGEQKLVRKKRALWEEFYASCMLWYVGLFSFSLPKRKDKSRINIS